MDVFGQPYLYSYTFRTNMFHCSRKSKFAGQDPTQYHVNMFIIITLLKLKA